MSILNKNFNLFVSSGKLLFHINLSECKFNLINQKMHCEHAMAIIAVNNRESN